ncbi:MAG TPA: DUF3857 domain-containing protein [Candidatus Acidoferrales bacterium]
MMERIVSGLILLGVLTASRVPPAFARPQAQAPTEKPADYSNEAYVIESRSTQVTFENDGTSSTVVKGRVRIQSQAGVQGFGVLNFPYASGNSTMEIVHVRVVKPDGRVVETPLDNVLDMPADITRQAPFYSDLKAMQVAVKGLEVGDVIELESQERVTKPLDPGQFWGNFQFFRGGIILRETLEIRVPKNRAAQVKSAKIQPTIDQDGAYRVYRWTTSNLSSPSTDDKEANSAEPPPPDVQLTTFRSWDEVGQWLRSLFAPRATPTPEIQAKAAELTRGAATDIDKIKAIYAFVSTKYRYIGISFGIGRMQPHPAEDILSNGYGDCKDKHTLLTSLLAAAGIKAYPAFINSQTKIDPDVPSPAQFDHVITAIPQGKGFLFLDATPEVGPFGFLMANLRDKTALVISDGGAVAQLAQTPADPPFPSYFKFEANGTLDALGTLDTKVQMTFRGDPELIYRLVLRQSGQSQWKDVMQKISQNLGFGGTVSDVTASLPDDTEKPFEIAYSYKREKYSDWDDRQIGPPFPPVFIPPAPDEKDQNPKPIQLGSPGVTDYKAAIHLPPNSSPQLPPSIHLSESFAEYTATYSFSDGVLHAERRLETKAHELAPGRMEPYRAFSKAILDDENRFIPLSGGGVSLAADVSGSLEARDLYAQGQRAMMDRNIAAAEDDLQRAVMKDPKYAQAWATLGVMHAGRDPDKAIEELKKAITLQPSWMDPYRPLTTLLMSQHRVDEAIAVWRDLEKSAPENPEAPERIGSILMTQKRYADAVPEFEAAVRLDPEKSAFTVALGEAYARSGNKEKAIPILRKIAENDAISANELNEAAYALADTNLQLDDALKYAQRAVNKEEGETAGIKLDQLDPGNLRTPVALAAYWDTLGWVYFRMGKFDEAEKYISSAWRLAQDPVVGDHLGQIYEKEGKRQEAIKAYSNTLATQHAPDGTKARLDALHPGDTATGWGVLELQNTRMTEVEVSPKPKRHASAEFFILFAPGPKVAAVKFLNDRDEFAGAKEALKTAKFEVPFPDDGPVQVLRRGFIDCEPELQECTIALIPPADVHAVN